MVTLLRVLTRTERRLFKVSRAVQHKHSSLSKQKAFTFRIWRGKKNTKNRAKQSHVHCLPPIVLSKWCGPLAVRGKFSVAWKQEMCSRRCFSSHLWFRVQMCEPLPLLLCTSLFCNMLHFETLTLFYHYFKIKDANKENKGLFCASKVCSAVQHARACASFCEASDRRKEDSWIKQKYWLCAKNKTSLSHTRQCKFSLFVCKQCRKFLHQKREKIFF